MKIRILIMDDSPETLDTLSLLFESHPDMDVVGAVHSVTEAVEVLTATTVDIVSIDINLRFGSGFQLCEHVHDHYPDVFITMCSVEAHDRNKTLASRAGAHHFLGKPLSFNDIDDLTVRYKDFRNQRSEPEKHMNHEENWIDRIVTDTLHNRNG